MAHETSSLTNEFTIDRFAYRTVYQDSEIGAIVLHPTAKVLDKWGRDPDESLHLSSRIPLSIRDDGSVRCVGQSEW